MDYFFYNTDANAITDPPRPRYRVLIENGFAAVGGGKQFSDQFRPLKPDDILLMYENGEGVVGIGRVREEWDGIPQTVPRYYTAAEMLRLTDGPYEYRIQVEWFLDLSGSAIGVDELRTRFGYKPGAAVARGAVRKIVKQRDKVARLIEDSQAAQALLPGEVARPTQYVEGATRRIAVNAFERSREAVRACKARQGTTCVVCEFDFATCYGDEFAGFIHVHHKRPLSEVGAEYRVDPAVDLCPVCPNCHAAIHHGGRLRTVEEVRQLVNVRRRYS